MSGIKVAQHKIFKISTEHLKEKVEQERKEKLKNDIVTDNNKSNKTKKNSPWELTIDKEKADELGELICLFDSQMFRLIKIILEERFKKENPDENFDEENIDYTKYVFSLIVGNNGRDIEDFKYVVENGFKINGVSFKRFVGTTGGLKQNSVLFVNEGIIDELNERVTSRTIDKELVPAKYEAYKALTCSSSQPIVEPDEILVVTDCFTEYMDTIIELDDTVETDNGEPYRSESKDVLLQNNASDGFNLCTIEYMEKCCEALGINYVSGGLCLRNKWLKGMMYPFPIKEFVEKYNNGNSIVKDIWGNEKDLNKVDLILTESSLKLWSSYTSIKDYVDNYRKSGYRFAVTKICPDVLEDERGLNYQYLQSYDFTDDNIKELCQPTIDFLKGAMGNNYDDVIKFLGINDNTDDYGWQHGLKTSSYMLNDPYIIDSIHRFIKKKIDEAKIGKLICKGNYQTFSNDPVCLMEHICGLEVKGLLKKNQCYSSYWIKKYPDTKEILAFRSPMTCHNNIRKLEIVNNEDTRYWYQYMYNIFIVNSFDSFAKAENGEDADGDQNFLTNNEILIRCYRNEPAISCIQKTADKFSINEEILFRSNYMAFGNNVGTITNYVTSMLEVQSRFEKDSDEYKTLEYRIECGQLYQQNCLDSIKGIVAKPMPNYWSKRNYCVVKDMNGKIARDENGDPIKDYYQLSLCADKKPYFMIYRYSEENKKYKKYLNTNNIKCMQLFGITLEELLNIPEENLTEEMNNFKKWYNIKFPVGMGNCAMNKICWYVENEMDGYKSKLKKNKKFDYTILKNKIRLNDKTREVYQKYSEDIEKVCKQYINRISLFKKRNNDSNNKEDSIVDRSELKKWAKSKVHEVCPNAKYRLNIVLDLCYGDKNMNKQFCWDTVGRLIIQRLEEIENAKIDNE